MKMVQSCSMPKWWPLSALVSFGLAFLMLPVATTGLTLHRGSAPTPAVAPAGGPAPAPAGAPAPVPVPAPAATLAAAPPIRPGIVVQITMSKEKLRAYSLTAGLRYVPAMDEMLGKTYVVKEINYGGVGLPSPNGSQDQVWYFPPEALTPWLDTPAAKQVPVASRGFGAVGLPTDAKIEIIPPGRHDAPWQYQIKGQNLMRPIGPPLDEEVDLSKQVNHLHWRKVQQIASVECLEKLHKDPSHLCKAQAYTTYNSVTPIPETEKPLTPEETKVLKDKLKHLQTTVDNLSPKQRKRVKMSFKVPTVKNTNSTLGTAHKHSNRHLAGDVQSKSMKVGGKTSDERLHTAQGSAEEETLQGHAWQESHQGQGNIGLPSPVQ